MEATASKNQGKFAQNIRNRELEICKICGEPTQYLVNIPLMNKRFLAHINCRCERKKLEIQRENEIKQENWQKSQSSKIFHLSAKDTKMLVLKALKLGTILVLTKLLSVARDIVKITKKSTKMATEFIFLVQKERAKHM